MSAVEWRHWAVRAFLAGVLAACGACSNLNVKKVPVEERACGGDREQGFRYYLNRPYLVVNKPILISQSASLVRVKPPKLGTGKAAGDAEVEFLEGPRRGQKTRLADLRVEVPGSADVRTVSPAELRRMAAVLAAGESRSSPAAGADGQVVPVQFMLRDGMELSTPAAGSAPSSTGAALAGTGAANASTVNTDSIDIKNVATSGVTHTDPLAGDMQVLYLPDLDEQYVIKSENLVAKSAFGLAFRNGSELVEVQGEHDATTLALSLFQQIQAAIASVQGVEQARVQQQAKQLQAAQGGKSTGAARSGLDTPGVEPIWQLLQRTSIKPGVYRLNKPWETKDGPDAHPVGCGLLAKLGLPTVVDVDFKPVAALKKD